jgi:hypothetical protein
MKKVEKFYLIKNSGEIVTFIPPKPILFSRYYALKYQYEKIFKIGTVRLHIEKLHRVQPHFGTIQPPE